MRKTTLLIGAAVLGLLTVLPGTASATQRAELLRLSWGGAIPEPGDPLLVYVRSDGGGQDQSRFDDVVMANESMLLAAKFFTCVEIGEGEAREHALFAKVKFNPPAMVAFDSTREEHSVAGGRASGMKVYGVLCKVGQLDYETSVAKTVRAARNLLGSYDRIDAAQDALGIKRARLDDARGSAGSAKIRKLEVEIAKDQKAIDELAEKTNTTWSEIWDLKRKKREAAGPEGAEGDSGD